LSVLEEGKAVKTDNTEHRQRKREEIDVSYYRLCDSEDEEVGRERLSVSG